MCVGLAPGQPGIPAGAQPPQMVSTGASGQRLAFAGLPATTPAGATHVARPIQPVTNYCVVLTLTPGTLKIAHVIRRAKALSAGLWRRGEIT